MSSCSNYLQNKLVDHIMKATAFTAPANLYVSLWTAGPAADGTGTEVSGGSYARAQLNPSATTNWTNTQGGSSGASTGTSGNSSNVATLSFPQATANWGTIVGVGIHDASTSGNMLFYGALSSTRVVNNGDQFQYPANSLVCNWS